MYTALKKFLTSWNDTTSDRDKLQHLYLTVALALLILAGVLGLINHTLGQQILAVSIASAAVFLINAVAWALLQSFVLLRINRSEEKRARVSTPKSATRKK